MKRISFLLVVTSLCCASPLRAQDAAVDERLNKLSGQIDDLLAAKAEQDKRIAALVKEVEGLRELASKPTGNYASAEDVRKLAETVQKIDANRIADAERIAKEIEKLAKAPAAGGTRTPKTPKPPVDDPGKGSSATSGGTGSGPEKGFEYVIAPDDTLSTIALKCKKEKGIKVTPDQILKANPGLKERNLQVGKKIFIPTTAEK